MPNEPLSPLVSTTVKNISAVPYYVPLGRQSRWLAANETATVFGDVLSGYYGEESAKGIAKMLEEGTLTILNSPAKIVADTAVAGAAYAVTVTSGAVTLTQVATP